MIDERYPLAIVSFCLSAVRSSTNPLRLFPILYQLCGYISTLMVPVEGSAIYNPGYLLLFINLSSVVIFKPP